MKLGLVTYNLAKDWDLDRIIDMCAEHDFRGVELRTTHAHGVEVDLDGRQRREVREKFMDSPVELAGLGSAFEYHSADPEEVRRNVDGTKEYTRLAAEVGAPGVKVRPNGMQTDRGVDEEITLRQIGEALAECADYADGLDVEIRLEVHGSETKDPARIRRIIDYADHRNALVCWNSNAYEVENGSIEDNFELLAEEIALVHMRDLCADDYPWLELLRLLRQREYGGFCLAEIPASEQPGRIMDYYRTVWEAYHHVLDLEGVPRESA
ncbi:MAG: sugar phosphate isomerase/epimerase family protein [Planctomycetota bacterium]